MVALLGPPPPKFLQRSDKCAKYFDASGNWLGSVPIPDQSFEQRATQLKGPDKELMLNLFRKALQWLPEDRPTAEELAFDDWLMEAYMESKAEQQ
ncbi:Putative Protein kinase-like protein [[Torrubiella] hemipterigena]|uniref:Protein kinase domain-containing protein n=1 Tax=[Torrubiella] hemipterigena TaxID=1531966 RepID=A0A0A1T439_9HYPO|nr:Putative Protein kinase-like protein [[Torrubiella] hemipterigena]